MRVAHFLLLLSQLSKEIQRKQEALLGQDNAEYMKNTWQL
jgi:hypothetical protein